MKTAAILTRYQSRNDGDAIINIPALFYDIVPALGDSYEDITEQPNLPPVPNVVVVKATVSPDTLAKIKLHPLYKGAVLWEDGEDIEATIPQTRLAAVVQHLAKRIRTRFSDIDEQWVQQNVIQNQAPTVADVINAIIAYLRFHPSQAPVSP